jgi:hypothetical protein
VVIWYIFPILVCFDQEKSGNPGKYRVEMELSRLPAINKLRMYNPGYKQFLLPSAAALLIALL